MILVGVFLILLVNVSALIYGPFLIGKERQPYTAGAYIVQLFYSGLLIYLLLRAYL